MIHSNLMLQRYEQCEWFILWNGVVLSALRLLTIFYDPLKVYIHPERSARLPGTFLPGLPRCVRA